MIYIGINTNKAQEPCLNSDAAFLSLSGKNTKSIIIFELRLGQELATISGM